MRRSYPFTTEQIMLINTLSALGDTGSNQALRKSGNTIYNGDILGTLQYMGTWNASTNNPSIASGVGVAGQFYIVSVAGTTNIDGTNHWEVGDNILFNGVTWERIGAQSVHTLAELTDVSLLSPANGNFLKYNGSAWVNSNLSASDMPSGIDAAKIGAGTVSNTEYGFLDGVTSSIQTQFSGKEPTITGGTTAQYWRGDKTFQTLNTTVVPEGTNLYYTTSRFNSDFASKSTSNLTEGTNLYYTNARAIGATLTGYSASPGVVSSSDTILSALQKIDGNVGVFSTHNNLSGLQGGATSQYYHLTSAEYSGSGTGVFARKNNTVLTGTTAVDALTSVNPIFVGGQATSASVGIELGNYSGGTPYIDFHNSSADYEARLMLANATTLQLQFSSVGAFNVYADLYSGGTVSTAYGFISSGGYISNSVSGTTLANFINSIPPYSYIIRAPYVSSGYTNGVYWHTTDDNPYNPKAGIFTQLTSSGSYMYLGTSNSYATGITSWISIDYNGSLGIGGVPTHPLMVKSAAATGVANALIYNTNASSSVALELRDAAATPNQWWLGSGLVSGSDGVFFVYDKRQSAVRLSIDTAGKVSVNGATSGIGILDVNGSVSLNNNYVASSAGLNPGYYTFASGATAYGMKLHWDGANFGTFLFAPNGADRFVGMGTVGGSGGSDGDFTIQMRLSTSTGNVGIWTTQSEIIGANSARFTVRQSAANSSAIYNGWIAASFGGNGGTGDVVVIGGASDKAIIGGHNYAHTAWSNIYLNYGGGSVIVGDTAGIVSKFQVSDGQIYGGSAISPYTLLQGGALGNTAGDSTMMASIGFKPAGNVVSLGVQAIRNANGSSWIDTSVGLRYNVDSTISASTSGASNSIWFNSNGTINIGDVIDAAGGNLIISHTSSPGSANTVYMTVKNRGTGGGALDMYVSNNSGYLGPSVGLSWSNASPFKFSVNGSPVAQISTNGCWGIFDTSGDAYLHLGAGTSSFAPFKLTSGTNLATPQDGAVEYDGSHVYATIGSTRYQLDQQSGDPYPIYIPGNAVNFVWYSDRKDMLAISTTSSTDLYLTDALVIDDSIGGASQNIRYLSGAKQIITITSIWASATYITGLMIKGGYVYVSLYASGVANRIYRCAVTSDISSAGNWTQLTISGKALENNSDAGLIGFGNGYFWVTHTTDGLVPYSLSGTTLTSSTVVTVSGATYSAFSARVNNTGIYAYFTSAPCIRFANFSGVLDGTKQVSATDGVAFVLDGAAYIGSSYSWSKLNF